MSETDPAWANRRESKLGAGGPLLAERMRASAMQQIGPTSPYALDGVHVGAGRIRHWELPRWPSQRDLTGDEDDSIVDYLKRKQEREHAWQVLVSMARLDAVAQPLCRKDARHGCRYGRGNAMGYLEHVLDAVLWNHNIIGHNNQERFVKPAKGGIGI